MEELQQKIIKWAEEKGIFEKSDPSSQFLKTIEEVGELASAVNKNDIPEIKDAIGDVAVTLIIHAEMTVEDIDFYADTYKYGNPKDSVFAMLGGLCEVDYDSIIGHLKTIADMYGWTFEECLQSAYDVISKRTGKMENGVFVKDK